MEEALKSFHLADLVNLVPANVLAILLTLALSFLIGLEREEHKLESKSYNFGGVRTFPLLGLCGYMMASLSPNEPWMIGLGFVVIGALFWLSYRKKLEVSSTAGLTTEMSGLYTFLMGALIFHQARWEATALTVIVLLLLELKAGLESLAVKIPPSEIFTFTRFLLISAVILPMVPDRDFTNLHLNPYHTWLIVVVISGFSYAAYVIEKIIGPSRGLIVAAIMGGIYSSTSTTVVLAKKSKFEAPNHQYAGAIIIASAFMYFRLVALLMIFNWNLGMRLLAPFTVMGVLFLLVGGIWFWLLGKNHEKEKTDIKLESRNPLELQSAFVFAAIFAVMGVLTAYALQYLGSSGIFGLSFFTGLTDVDPFVMSLTQSSGNVLTEQTAASGILIATASNNLMKGLYAALWGVDGVKKYASMSLVGLGLISLLALIFI